MSKILQKNPFKIYSGNSDTCNDVMGDKTVYMSLNSVNIQSTQENIINRFASYIFEKSTGSRSTQIDNDTNS